LLPLILFLAFLFPLAVYCFVLALVNRRTHPVMVSGTWDFVGVLFAASGLLLVVGPAIVSSLSDRWRMLWLLGRLPGVGEDGSGIWAVLASLYVVAVVGGCAYQLWQRTWSTSVYNVEPAVFDDALAGVLDGLGLSWARAGARYFLRYPTPARAGAVPRHAGAVPLPGGLEGGNGGSKDLPSDDVPAAGFRERSAVLAAEPFPPMRHVTLRWEAADPELRHEVEAELRKALAGVYTAHNPAGTWLLTVSAGLFCVLFLGVVLMVVLPLLLMRT